MAFESLKKLFGLHKYDQTPNHQMELIDEEIDSFEKEIQEYMAYSESRNKGPAGQPEVLSRGGGISSSTIITPEEQKRIEGEN